MVVQAESTYGKPRIASRSLVDCMERSGMQGSLRQAIPDFAALHPGYACFRDHLGLCRTWLF